MVLLSSASVVAYSLILLGEILSREAFLDLFRDSIFSLTSLLYFLSYLSVCKRICCCNLFLSSISKSSWFIFWKDSGFVEWIYNLLISSSSVILLNSSFRVFFLALSCLTLLFVDFLCTGSKLGSIVEKSAPFVTLSASECSCSYVIDFWTILLPSLNFRSSSVYRVVQQ